MTEADVLFASLPKAARDAFTRALEAMERSKAGEKAAYDESQMAVTEALQEGDDERWSRRGLPARVELRRDPTSRVALERARGARDVAVRVSFVSRDTPAVLGVKPGLLETKRVGGEPLWRALQSNKEGMVAILDALPLHEALGVLEEIWSTGYHIDDVGHLVDGKLRLFRELKDEGRAWAIERANAFPTDATHQGAPIKAFIFLALVRAKVPIEPRWDHLFPLVTCARGELLKECARAIPKERRAAALQPHFASLRCVGRVR